MKICNLLEITMLHTIKKGHFLFSAFVEWEQNENRKSFNYKKLITRYLSHNPLTKLAFGAAENSRE
jgi:hypothetical protein